MAPAPPTPLAACPQQQMPPVAHSGAPTTYRGYIETVDDALLVFEACRLGMLQRRTGRLCEAERQYIASGSVYVWDEGESGIRRWTDGKRWSPSRVNGCFLIYTELEPKDSSAKLNAATPKSQTSTSTDSVPKSDGLTKKALSLFTTHNNKLHLVCYYSKADFDSGELLSPARDSMLCNIEIPRSLYPDILPEMVHILSNPPSMPHHSEQVRRMSAAQLPLADNRSQRHKASLLLRPFTPQTMVQPRYSERTTIDSSSASAFWNANDDDYSSKRRRRDSFACFSCMPEAATTAAPAALTPMPLGLVNIPFGRKHQTTTSHRDCEMLQSLDTTNSKPLPQTTVPMKRPAAAGFYSRPLPPSFALPLQNSRSAQQQSVADLRSSSSHPSTPPYGRENSTLPAIGARRRNMYAGVAGGSATTPSSRRNTAYYPADEGEKSNVSLPPISELLSSITTIQPPPHHGQTSSNAGVDSRKELGGTNLQSFLQNHGCNNPAGSRSNITVDLGLSASAKARAKYSDDPWSRQLWNYSIENHHMPTPVPQPYSLY